jgi:hypothetical protein
MQELKFQLSELEAQATVIDKLTVLSYEMNLYFVRLEVATRKGLVYLGDSPMRFQSSQHIRDIFESFKVLRAEMRHDSPYDEMIGNPDSAQYLGSLPFSMQQPY